MTHLTPEMERLVERQLRNWELARAQRFAKPRDPHEVCAFVAISRQVGAGGSEIAHLLAERIKWPLFDKELLHAMAGDDQVRERLYERMDERDTTWIEQAMEWVLRGRFLPQDYFPDLVQCVLALARGSHAVFLGRAADLILPRNQGLRVRVVAPLDQRVRRFGEREHTDDERAREELARIDQERADFIQRHFHRDIDDPTRCDLMINSAHLSVAEAGELILALLQKRRIVE
jgi:cytidylate kinase